MQKGCRLRLLIRTTRYLARFHVSSLSVLRLASSPPELASTCQLWPSSVWRAAGGRLPPSAFRLPSAFHFCHVHHGHGGQPFQLFITSLLTHSSRQAPMRSQSSRVVFGRVISWRRRQCPTLTSPLSHVNHRYFSSSKSSIPKIAVGASSTTKIDGTRWRGDK